MPGPQRQPGLWRPAWSALQENKQGWKTEGRFELCYLSIMSDDKKNLNTFMLGYTEKSDMEPVLFEYKYIGFISIESSV